MKTYTRAIAAIALLWMMSALCFAEDPIGISPLVRVVDLSVGQSVDVTLCDGSEVTVKLLAVKETRDNVSNAVRRAEVAVEVNGQPVTLVSATYHLPQTIGSVQIDCSVTKGYNENGSPRFWGLEKDARLRLWPAGSPLATPKTFTYPVKQKWFATDTQMANAPVYVDGGERSGKRKIYYHSGLDIGGSEGATEVVAATDSLVVSVGDVVLEGHSKDTPVSARYDVVYLLDGRGWYYRYSHLKEIDKDIVPGRVITQGDRIGLLGKEGGSGGWSHLHFEIKSRQPSGKWGTQEGYAFLWEAYLREFKPSLIAVARPHHLVFTGESVTLDGSRSWSKSGKIVNYEWRHHDGSTTKAARVERKYDQPGRYSEVLRITDGAGNVAYDFAPVIVVDRANPERLTPSIHPNYYPTTEIQPGTDVTFKVRTFNTTTGREVWDFGDGSKTVEVESDGNAVKLAADGYAVTTHRYEKPGDYVVRVARTNEHQVAAVGHLHVHVDEAPDSTTASQPPKAGNYSQPKHKVVAELNQKARMRDGVALMLDIYRPETPGRHPAVLLQTPYNKNGQATRAKYFAARGYVVVNVDSRGRFESGGEWDPFTPKHKTDGYDLVQWVAEQPWCSGNVGSYGLSYMGWTQWWTASQTPPALKAIVPEVAPPDHFYNCPYQNGIFVCWMMDWAGSTSARLPHSAGPGPYGGFAVNREQAYRLPYIDFDKTRNYQANKWWRKWIEQNTADGEYWKSIAYQTPKHYNQVKVPSLAISGWFDANFPGTPMNYLAMKKHGGALAARRPRMVIGPWEHIINRHREAAGVDFGPQAIIDWDGYVLRWFDYHLKGIDNGVLNDPPVHVFVMGRNQWRAASDWPLPDTQFTKFYLHSQGNANSSDGDGALNTQLPGDEPADRYTYDPNDPTPSAAFENGHIDGPRDISTSARRNDVLVYDTAKLTEEVEIVGPITARLFAALTSGPDTDWMIRLSDVYPDGRALFLGEGVMRARHRDPKRHGDFNPRSLSSIEPNQPYEYTIHFWRPTGNAFLPGHRIRIEISSSYYPYYLRNPNSANDNIGMVKEFQTANQSVVHDAKRPSHIVLPLIPRGKGHK